MTCPTENALARLLDARLSDAERSSIEHHLDACTECSHLVSELSWMIAPPLEGDAGRYRLRAEIARGGMGRVVEATDPVLGRVVAVKEALSEDDEVIRRFTRETRITARLEHPAIVPVYDAGVSADGTPYYVMRKVTGQPLAQLVEAARTVTDRLALIPHVVAVAHAIAHAHQRGIVHRDLKPSNILVGDNGETVVIDWGLAKVIGEVDDDHHAAAGIDPGGSLRTRLGAVFGTPGFIAPEQLRGEAVDARGDVYALGATLYFVLGRQPPHASPSEDDMMAAAAAGPPVPIADRVAGVPRELAAIVDKALAFDEQDRYSDGSALADDLQRFVTGQLISAHRYSPRERIARFVKRNRVGVAIAAASAIAIAVGGAFAITNVVHERDRADRQAVLATEHARDAEQRADDLIVLQADTLVKTNPTAAVALVKQLRWPPERWQRMWTAVRGVAAGARSQGVAWAMPGPPDYFTPTMSRSGLRAAGTDYAGEVWVYDLVHHTDQKLDVLSPVRPAEFIDDDHVLLFQATRAISIELSTGTERVFPALVNIGQLELTPKAIVWSSKHVLYRTEIATGATTTLGSASENWFALAPDRRALAMVGEHGITIVDLDAPAMPHTITSAVQPGFVVWAADSDRLAVTAPGRIATVTRRDSHITWRDPAPSPFTAKPLFVGSHLYAGAGSLDIYDHDVRYPVMSSIDLGVGMSAVNGSYVVVVNSGIVHVVGRGWNAELDPPTSLLHAIISVPAGPYVVGAGAGRVFVWDVRDVLPKPQQLRRSSWSSTVGAHDLLVWGDLRDGAWVETDTGAITRLADLPAARVSMSTKDLAVAIADGEPPTRGYVVTKQHVDVFADDVLVAVLQGRAVVFATRTGEVARFDWTTHHRFPVFQRDAAIASIGVNGPWIAAAYDKGLVVRRDVETGVETELRIAAPEIVVLGDGRVCFPIELRIACWRLDGAVVTAFTLPAPATIVATDSERMFVATPSTVYAADFAHDTLTPIMPADSARAISPPADRAVIAGNFGQIDEVDLTTGRRWQVIQPGPLRIHSIALSADGTTVFGMVDIEGGQELTSWNVELPHDAAATARWLDQLTNASASAGAGSLAWP